jgi:chemotaxis family two-component system response regulator Rcp1
MTIASQTGTHLDPNLGRPVQILLVEDSPSDAAMTIEAIHEGRIVNQVHVATDGEVAMAFLRRQGPYADAVRPDLILLDLNLPEWTAARSCAR